MKATPKTYKLPVGWMIASLLLIIVGYNYWSYRCGYCTISSLLSLSAPAILLIVLNVIACLVLLAVKLRSRQQLQRQRCNCGKTLRNTWQYCPDCGGARQN
ncbi:MAG TPA: hypothetical protein VIR78_05530 [Malonomonas sp.]